MQAATTKRNRPTGSQLKKLMELADTDFAGHLETARDLYRLFPLWVTDETFPALWSRAFKRGWKDDPQSRPPDASKYSAHGDGVIEEIYRKSTAGQTTEAPAEDNEVPWWV